MFILSRQKIRYVNLDGRRWTWRKSLSDLTIRVKRKSSCFSRSLYSGWLIRRSSRSSLSVLTSSVKRSSTAVNENFSSVNKYYSCSRSLFLNNQSIVVEVRFSWTYLLSLFHLSIPVSFDRQSSRTYPTEDHLPKRNLHLSWRQMELQWEKIGFFRRRPTRTYSLRERRTIAVKHWDLHAFRLPSESRGNLSKTSVSWVHVLLRVSLQLARRTCKQQANERAIHALFLFTPAHEKRKRKHLSLPSTDFRDREGEEQCTTAVCTRAMMMMMLIARAKEMRVLRSPETSRERQREQEKTQHIDQRSDISFLSRICQYRWY